MKKWICYHLFGEKPESVDIFGMISGLTIVGFLFGCCFFLLVFIPVYVCML